MSLPMGQRSFCSEPSRARIAVLGLSSIVTLALFGVARAESGSPFAGSLSFATSAPQASAYSDGDDGVVEERGAVTYRVPIAVPPGRGGAVPSVGLRYSSQGELRGGVAAGWELDAGLLVIERDIRAAYFHYGAFGEVVKQTGDENHRRQFNGKERDKSTGWGYYYGARYYEPMSMRWVSGDPLYRFAPEAGYVEPQRQNPMHFH